MVKKKIDDIQYLKTKNGLKNSTNHEYIFGDYDQDGVKNIDDYRPFDEQRHKDTRHKKNYKARFTDKETPMSKVLNNIRNELNSNSRNLRKHISKEKSKNKKINIFGRIKSAPSYLNKLHKKHGKKIMDKSGSTILLKKRISRNKNLVLKEVKRIKNNYKVDKNEEDDYYAKPKNDVYYAHHLSLLNNNKRIELQIKSSKMYEFQDGMHGDYKRLNKAQIRRKYSAKAKKLFEKGY